MGLAEKNVKIEDSYIRTRRQKSVIFEAKEVITSAVLKRHEKKTHNFDGKVTEI